MTTSDIITSCILGFGIFVAISLLWYEKKTKAPAIPTLPWVRKKMLNGLKRYTEENKSYKIAELGSGWGGLTVKTAKAFPNSTVTGYELAYFPYLFSKIRGILSLRKVKFRRADFFKEDLNQYDILVCYLLPWHMKELKPQFEKLKPGTLIVANAYGIPGWEPIDIQHTEIVMKIPIFVYKK